ncbi:hypothetical protein IQ37_16640 [Chryseobacterium piperi]|uniref:Rieske domain-containing protein n=1 Tax=Chryseobacterium piperi TaxID=558152 RepID=A0A086APY0_9FLAO|nr:hypothetical protein [Chryseobacterium piperi]ASW74808.1 hypothetical protein CJF12_11325 [Chryseobacterium piperi]KFF18744.1 hypothetical protein IQ37_16640 [Chryseobacterium piperi]
MKKTFSIVSIFTLLIISVLNINSCGSREDTVSCFPRTPINVSLNLNLPAYFNLTQPQGWIYVNEQQSGTRGLIVVRRSDTQFMVYDRNAPHLCPDSNTTLEVKDNISIVCPKDNATWILLTGNPTNTSVTSLPPKTYPYNYDPATRVLNIYF